MIAEPLDGQSSWASPDRRKPSTPPDTYWSRRCEGPPETRLAEAAMFLTALETLGASVYTLYSRYSSVVWAGSVMGYLYHT